MKDDRKNLKQFMAVYGIVDAAIVLRTHPTSLERQSQGIDPIPLPVQKWLAKWVEWPRT